MNHAELSPWDTAANVTTSSRRRARRIRLRALSREIRFHPHRGLSMVSSVLDHAYIVFRLNANSSLLFVGWSKSHTAVTSRRERLCKTHHQQRLPQRAKSTKFLNFDFCSSGTFRLTLSSQRARVNFFLFTKLRRASTFPYTEPKF